MSSAVPQAPSAPGAADLDSCSRARLIWGGCSAPSAVAKPLTRGDGAGATGALPTHRWWRRPAQATDLPRNFADAWRLVCGRSRASPATVAPSASPSAPPRPADLGSVACIFGLAKYRISAA